MQRGMRRWGIIGIILFAAWMLRAVIVDAAVILLGAVAVAMLINPLVRRLERYMPRGAAIACVWAIAGLGIGGLTALLVPLLSAQIMSLCNLVPQCGALYRETIGKWLPESVVSGVLDGAPVWIARVGSGVGDLVGSVYRAALAWVVSVFLLMDKERYLLKAELLIPCAHRRRVLRMGSRIMREWRLFLGGQLLVGLCVGILSAVGLAVIGVPDAPVLGLLTGIFNLIPYFGPAIAAVPVLITALADGWQQAALAGGVIFLVQQADGLYLSPKILSGATGLSPLTVLLALTVGGALLGIWGLLVAIPGAIAIRIIFSEIVQNGRIFDG